MCRSSTATVIYKKNKENYLNIDIKNLSYFSENGYKNA